MAKPLDVLKSLGRMAKKEFVPSIGPVKGGIITEMKGDKGIRIRLKKDFHGRMVIIDDQLFVGSVDLDNQGLNVHDNLTIETTDTTALLSAKDLFLELEQAS